MKCKHGHEPDPIASYSWKPSNSIMNMIAKHAKKCPNYVPFWHQGLIFKSVCCATCGRQIY